VSATGDYRQDHHEPCAGTLYHHARTFPCVRHAINTQCVSHREGYRESQRSLARSLTKRAFRAGECAAANNGLLLLHLLKRIQCIHYTPPSL
jgi:hypothetical protein